MGIEKESLQYPCIRLDKAINLFRIEISKTLFELMDVYGITVNELINYTGLSKVTINNVLYCKNDYDLESAFQIAYVLQDKLVKSIKPKLSIMIQLWEICSEDEKEIFKQYIEKIK